MFVVAASLSGERDDVTEAVQLATLVLISVLLIASVLAWAVAGRILAPLRTLDETARSISETDLTRRIPVSGNDEIAELARTFNAMVDRLDRAFASQRAFVSDASHELRTPITIVRGHLELLGDDPQERRETIALVTDELDRMSRFVNDLLLLAKAERQDFLRIEEVELGALTDELLEKATGLGPRTWALEGRAEARIQADRQRLTQAIMGLAQNAVQHTSDGDAIWIGTGVDDGEVSLWVRDSGPGIPREDQVRVFERFARAAASPPPLRGRRPRAGDRARDRRGARRARGAGEHAGSRIDLHRCRADGRTGDDQMSRILIAEDEPRLSSFLEKGLRAAGYTTTVCDDGVRAAALARSEDFELLILDIGLPGQDGFAVLRALRAREERLPVLILTARDEVTDMVAGLDHGADDYVTKPFVFDELLARVRARLRQTGGAPATQMELNAGGITLDVRTRRASSESGGEAELTAKEFSLLETFLRHPGQVLSREQLLSHVWGYDFDPGSNVVDVYVGYLRRKLGSERFETVRAWGIACGRSPGIREAIPKRPKQRAKPARKDRLSRSRCAATRADG